MKRMWSKNELKEIVKGTQGYNFVNLVDKDGHPVLIEFDIVDQLTNSLTKEGKYFKCVRNFNELQFIINIRLFNATEEVITIANDTRIGYVNLPTYLQDKIYSHSGIKLSLLEENTSIASAVLCITGTNGQTNAQNPRYLNLFGTTDKSITLFLEGGAITINARQRLDLEARISLWL